MVNTLTDTPNDVTPTDSAARVTGQQAAVAALLTLMSSNVAAPAANVSVNPSWRLQVNTHDSDAFEWWREALGLDPSDAGDLALFPDFSSFDIEGRIGDTEVRLVAILPLPAELPDAAA